jgi:hypothetical protein
MLLVCVCLAIFGIYLVLKVDFSNLGFAALFIGLSFYAAMEVLKGKTIQFQQPTRTVVIRRWLGPTQNFPFADIRQIVFETSYIEMKTEQQVRKAPKFTLALRLHTGERIDLIETGQVYKIQRDILREWMKHLIGDSVSPEIQIVE